ncbi:MAG: transcription antitermination factor NusB, partial [Tepidanaerobacteraceae bacterium]|nr:transcription antitermination factor NusB [Tepidanaerobacteraceae bacterium]
MVKPRELAISILVKTQEGFYGNLLLNKYLKSDILQKDRALITELVYGVMQNKIRLDHIISQFSKMKLSQISPFVKNAIRLGIYQGLFLDKVPVFAAVNESVDIVKRHEGKRAANFTNAILRSVFRDKDKISYPNKEKNIEEYLSVYYSFSPWLISRWSELFDVDFTERLCKAFNERPKLCIRINTIIATKEEIIARLSAEGVSMLPGYFADEALYLLDSPPINQLKSFSDGLVTPQDESSILASLALGVESTDMVLDVAAAPGGKTTHIAALMKNKGKIVAWDIHSHRIKLLKQNCERL